MKTICLYFQIHQPFRLRKFRFFDIGRQHYYYDDYTNELIMRKIANRCYLPANNILLELIQKHGQDFKVSFSISGTALDQFELYAPDVLESFVELSRTGSVEFLAETDSHSLASLVHKEEFMVQVNAHREKIERLFGQTPVAFRNTELIYSDLIGEDVLELGFNTMLTEGARHVLGWKSPNFMYCNTLNPRLKLLLKNYKLSDDIELHFSNRQSPVFPLTASKFAGWLNALDEREENVNLFMHYETFGEHHGKESGIFDFLKHLPTEVLKKTNYSFTTPSEAVKNMQTVGGLSVPNPISWTDEERDVSAWQGNELQQEALQKLYALRDKVYRSNDSTIRKDWKYLQASDHFYFMCTKFFVDGAGTTKFNPFASPYDAFINYMNILSDFEIRIDRSINEVSCMDEINNLKAILADKNAQVDQCRKELNRMKSIVGRNRAGAPGKVVADAAKMEPAKKAPAKKSTSKAASKASTVKKTESKTATKTKTKNVSSKASRGK
jgi:alpha-amylase